MKKAQIVFKLCKLTVSFLFLVLTGYKPIRLFPTNNETVIEEGESLRIVCRSDTPLQLIYPNIAEEAVRISINFITFSFNIYCLIN